MKKQIIFEDRYKRRKIQNKCTYCGKKIDRDNPNQKCEICLLRTRISNIDSRLRRIEIFIDNHLKDKEQKI